MPAVHPGMREHPRVEITLRALNRATLARQLLLEREQADVTEAVDRLGGLQAQEAKPPYLALWARLAGFCREQLHDALHAGTILRATAMRATLHLIGAAGYPALRATLQPVLTGAMAAIRGRDAGLDLDAVLRSARKLVEREPRTFGELRALLVQEFPGVNERALGYATRMNLPLAMVPSDDRWSFPADARFALTEIGQPDPQALVRRHLAAFGPATAADVQTWSGLGGLREVVESMELTEIKYGRRTLYDLPDAPRPSEDMPAPVRLLPEFDSLLLAHKDRTRVVADEHRKSLTTKNLRVKAVFLVDGFVAGTHSTARKRDAATLTLSPFAKLPRAVAAELRAEAEELMRFAEPDAVKRRVEFSAG
jgi:hypothetical protein